MKIEKLRADYKLRLEKLNDEEVLYERFTNPFEVIWFDPNFKND